MRKKESLSMRLQAIRELKLTNPCLECLIRSGCSIKRLLNEPLGAEMSSQQIKFMLSCKPLQAYQGYKQLEIIKPDRILRDKNGNNLNLLEHIIYRVEKDLKDSKNGLHI